MVNLSKEVLNMRFDNIETYRHKLISEVKEKRKNIINEIEQNKEKSKSKSKHDIINDDEEIEKEINAMVEKGTKTLDKLRQQQKCIIEAQIETKIKKEIIKLKSDKKERKIKELNEKIKEERKLKTILEEQKIKEKEKIRKQVVEKNLKEKEKKNEEKQKIEERRLKEFQELQEKNQIEILFRKTQTFKLLEKRKEKILNQLKETEKKNKEIEEKNIKREKELEELLKKEREERILLNEKKEKENKERIIKNKIKKEKSIENLKKLLELKDEITQKRLNGLLTKRHRSIQEQKLKYENKLKSIENAIKKTNYDLQQRNDKILERQLHVDINVARIERQKNEKILERVKSQNFLFLKSLKTRENNFKKLQEKFFEINKKLEYKDKLINEKKIYKSKSRTIKQEDEFIKQYEKQHNIIRLNRISNLKNKKLVEALSKKEKKIEKYKMRKQILMEKNILLGDSIEKQKVKLIDEFDNVLKKSKEINADLVKKLFPEDKKFYDKIKQMTDEVYKKYNIEKIDDNNNYNSEKDKEFFLTQHNNNKNENKDENKNENKSELKEEKKDKEK